MEIIGCILIVYFFVLFLLANDTVITNISISSIINNIIININIIITIIIIFIFLILICYYIMVIILQYNIICS